MAVISLKTIMKFKLFFFPLILIGCSSDKQHDVSRQQFQKDFSTLMAKYQDITIDTLELHYYSGDGEKSKFFGSSIDSTQTRLLPKDINIGDYYGAFACYKFKIDDMKTGLITRTPSMYESASINLLVYDQKVNNITQNVQLATEWGDAGAAFNQTSWLFFNSKKELCALTIEKYSYDHSIEDEKDTIVEYKTKYYLTNITSNTKDTVKNNYDNLLYLTEKTSH